MEIKKTSDVENHHIYALIVGSSGSGKTSLAKTLNHPNTLILSAESGLLSIKDAEIDVIDINTFQDLVDAIKFINGETKYENIFIDSLTEIGEILMHEVSPKYSKSQTFGKYEEYSSRMIAMLKLLRDMTKYDIYFTCLDRMEKKDYTEFITLDLHQKSLSKKIPALFDEVFYMTSVEHEGGSKRVLITDNSITDFAKDRSGNLDKIEKPDLGNIRKKIFA